MINCKKRSSFLVLLIGITTFFCSKETPFQEHSLTSRMFQGIPSLSISPNGRLWATWYAGKTPGEDKNNYVVVATSGDNGITWNEDFILDPDAEGPLRAFDPELWIDPEGRLWSFWAETIEHDGKIAGLWAKINNDPDNGNTKWSEPRRITDGIMMCKPTVLSTSEWILPVSTWRDNDYSARVVVSTDKGNSFSIRGACNVPIEIRNYDEHMIVERNDKSLWMLIRTSYGIGESLSIDRGKTWSTPVPSAIQHPSARFFIRRLFSGNLLLVKHGPINERTERSHLTAYLSEDDGRTWSNGLLLDERSGVSYPDGQQSSDGTIHIIYDYFRTGAKEILMSKFIENDILKGDVESATVSLRMVVSSNPEKVLPPALQSMYLLADGITSGIKADFFNNENLEGEPIASRIDKSINFYWGPKISPIPGIVNDDKFSIRWTGKLKSPGNGGYEIGLKADNGVKLFIDGNLLIDAWTDQAPGHSKTKHFEFEEGRLYDIKVEFYENMGSCEARLGIAPLIKAK